MGFTVLYSSNALFRATLQTLVFVVFIVRRDILRISRLRPAQDAAPGREWRYKYWNRRIFYT